MGETKTVEWYSATLRVALVVEGLGVTKYMLPVHLFRARDFREAMQRALLAGRKHEETYKNIDGQTVAWRLESVVTLDWVGEELADGLEISCGWEILDTPEPRSVDHVFRPEDSEPTQSVANMPRDAR